MTTVPCVNCGEAMKWEEAKTADLRDGECEQCFGAEVGWDTEDTDARHEKYSDWYKNDRARAAFGPRESSLLRLEDVEAKPIRWAWRDRMALGKLTAIAGRPKVGKGLLWSYLSAQVTQGTLDGDLEGPHNVIIVTTEDEPGDTIKPRLMAAGADVGRVFMFQMGSPEESVPFRVPQDADELRWRIEETSAALVVIDPLVEFIDGKVDSHKSHPVRQAIASLTKIARETGCAVLVIFHLNKGTSTDPLLRHEGSAAFTQVVRAGMLLGPDPDGNQDRRVLAVTSSNLARLASSLVYEIDSKIVTGDAGDPITTPYVRYVGESDADGHDLLSSGPTGDDGERSALREAEEFLRSELGAGPKPAKQVKATAGEMLIASRTLDRAKRQLGVEARKTSGTGPWEWSLSSTPSRAGALGQEDVGGLGQSRMFAGDSQGDEDQGRQPSDDGALARSDALHQREDE